MVVQSGRACVARPKKAAHVAAKKANGERGQVYWISSVTILVFSCALFSYVAAMAASAHGGEIGCATISEIQDKSGHFSPGTSFRAELGQSTAPTVNATLGDLSRQIARPPTPEARLALRAIALPRVAVKAKLRVPQWTKFAIEAHEAQPESGMQTAYALAPPASLSESSNILTTSADGCMASKASVTGGEEILGESLVRQPLSFSPVGGESLDRKALLTPIAIER